MSSLPTTRATVVLAERPAGGPVTPTTFRQESSPIPELKDGEVLVRVDYVSMEPTMRNWLNDARSYIEPIKIGAVMRSAGIGRVVASQSKDLSPGDLVYGTVGWQEYWVGPAEKVQVLRTPPGGKEIDHLGLFGLSGMTAYFGMFDIGRLKDGDTVVISGAAGSVGLIATQIALAHPQCRVIAIAGSDDKCNKLKSLGCHDVLNYKDEGFRKAFKDVGLIDVYFDNVGGEILDFALAQLKPYARIVACGMISTYNSTDPYRLRNARSLVSMKAKIEGFIALDYASRFAEGRAYLTDLKSKGKLQYDYMVLEPKAGESGLGRCVEALGLLFDGKNYGKTLVKVSNDAPSPNL